VLNGMLKKSTHSLVLFTKAPLRMYPQNGGCFVMAALEIIDKTCVLKPFVLSRRPLSMPYELCMCVCKTMDSES
jgi:hypothetical protein